MGSNVWDRAKGASANESGFDRGAALTRSLLGYGVLAGPFYLAVGLVQALVREGFDFSRHPLSVLANGPGGWVQTANFLLSGAMVLAAAVGFARALRPHSRAAGWILGCFGLSMVVAAIFRADPVDGFPVGTPPGVPTSVSTTGMLHFAAGGIGFLALTVSCFVVAVALSRRKERAMARISFLCGAAAAAGFFGPVAFSSSTNGIAGIWLGVVVGFAWLALTSLHLYRTSPDPNCAPGRS
jgi:hypothetical protein